MIFYGKLFLRIIFAFIVFNFSNSFAADDYYKKLSKKDHFSKMPVAPSEDPNLQSCFGAVWFLSKELLYWYRNRTLDESLLAMKGVSWVNVDSRVDSELATSGSDAKTDTSEDGSDSNWAHLD